MHCQTNVTQRLVTCALLRSELYEMLLWPLAGLLLDLLMQLSQVQILGHTCIFVNTQLVGVFNPIMCYFDFLFLLLFEWNVYQLAG